MTTLDPLVSHTEQAEPMRPVAPSERIVSLDVLRGFAILGILIVNIQSFAMPEAAYLNPTAYGDLIGLNQVAWILSHVFADQKFMTLFAILFGAGIVLMTDRSEAKGRKTAGLHYRRTFWLLVIGLIHAYLLWYGDILVLYAMCATVAFLFRRLAPGKLLIIGLLLIAVCPGIYTLAGLSMPHWPEEDYNDLLSTWKPDAELIEEEITTYRSGWTTQLPRRAATSFFFQTFVFLIWGVWRAGGLMLIGMALFKWGVLTAERSRRFYLILLCIGLGVGLPIVGTGVVRNFAAGWSLDYSMFLGVQFNYWGSLFVSLGYISAVMLMYQSFAQNKWTVWLSGIGRTALTNYLFQTVVCITLFYGHGLGWFGHVSRTYQLLIVVGVWALQLALTCLWLRYFRLGPVEWAWRSLTYFRWQPIRFVRA